jgi:parvulin-like peptidyl-prolyl cis-trans isomerase-like protein
LTSVRVAFCHFLLLSVVVGLGHAQDSGKEEAESKSPTFATAKKIQPSADRVIIKVGGVQVTEAEFESTIGDIEPQRDPDKAEAPGKNRRRLGDDYASVLMLSQQAVADHLDSSPEVRRQLEVARLQILSDAQFATLMSQTKASPEEISRYYDAHLSDFDRVQLRRLFIWKVGGGSKNTRGLPSEDAKARAAAILQASSSDGDPIKLAQVFQDSDLGIFDAQPLTFVRGQLPAKLDKVAFAIKPGQWAEAEDTPDHLILVYLLARDRQPLPEVASLVEKLVQGDKMQAKLDELKKKADIWMDELYFGSGSKVAKDPGEHRPVSQPLSETRN